MAKTRRTGRKTSLPKSIGIAAYRIPVVRPKEIHEGRAIGLWEPAPGRISVQKDLKGAAELATFLHEVVHAISDIYNLNLKHYAVHTLGEALAQALTDTT